MTKTIKVKGLMCPHCEMRMKKTMEELDGVEQCEASHSKGEITLTLSKEIDIEIIRQKVQQAGYSIV